jgi:hypothetical protein
MIGSPTRPARLSAVTVEYSLNKSEIVRSFFQGLHSSPKFLATIIIQALFAGLAYLVVSGTFARTLTWRDCLIALGWALGLLAFLPCWLLLRGKTTTRTLTISPGGIDTQIGQQRGTIPWQSVRLIKDAGNGIFIARANGNFFCIPNRAFSGRDDRSRFLAEVQLLRQQSQTQ